LFSVSRTALLAAVKRPDHRLVGLISSFARVNLNVGDRDGVTPILAAAYLGSFETVRLLSGMPAIDLTVRDSAGVQFVYTPIAISCGNCWGKCGNCC
jgi:hypothetical protein